MTLRGVGVALLLLAAAVPCSAQTPENGNPASSAPPAATKQAQNANATASNNSPSSNSANSTAENKKPKKVWTNDDIKSVPGQVSVVGHSNAAPNDAFSDEPERSETDDARQVQIENYRDQIQQLRGQIDSIDQRIAQLKNFKAENTSPSGGINIHHGYNTVPVEDQVKQLEDKKRKLEGKIDDVEVDARKNGIDPGELR